MESQNLLENTSKEKQNKRLYLNLKNNEKLSSTFIPTSHIHEDIACFMFSSGFPGWFTDPTGCKFGPFNLVNWPHQLKTAAVLAFKRNIFYEK